MSKKNTFDVVALRKVRKLALRVVNKVVTSTKNRREEESFEYGFTSDSDFFHKDGKVSLQDATGLDLPWSDANAELKKGIGLIGTKEVLVTKKVRISDWAIFSPAVEAFTTALTKSDEKVAIHVVSHLLDRHEFDQAIGTVNWTIPRLVHIAREKSGKKHFQEIWADQLLTEMINVLPELNRKVVAEKLANNPELKGKVSVEVLKSMMAAPLARLVAGIHDSTFKDVGNRYFTHTPCEAKERLSKTDYSKYKDGQAVKLSCPKCYYEGVISDKVRPVIAKPNDKKVEVRESTQPKSPYRFITKADDNVMNVEKVQAKTFVPAEHSHLKPVPKEEQERRAQEYVRCCIVGNSFSI